MSNGKKIVTVNGEISPNDLGITLTHEHLIIDSSFYIEFYPPTEEWKKKLLNQPIKMENLWIAKLENFCFRDNLVVDDVNLFINELKYFKNLGGSTVVDLTPVSLGGNPKLVKEIADKTKLNIVFGSGFYIEQSHPKYVADKSVEELSNEFTKQIIDGYEGTNIRAGILGEIGSGPIFTDQEKKVLKAVAYSHVKTGAPINVHLANIKGRNGMEVINILKDGKVNLEKVCLSHVDLLYKEFESQIELLNTGTYVGYDGFGEEDYIESLDYLPPRDMERVESIMKLIDKGYIDQILISQDHCRKTYLKKYGGQGFDHILRNMVPIMKEKGLTQKEINHILIENPKRFLAF